MSRFVALDEEAQKQIPEGLASMCLMLAEVVDKNTELHVNVDNTGNRMTISIDFRGYAKIKDRNKFDKVNLTAELMHDGEWLVTSFYPEKIYYA